MILLAITIWIYSGNIVQAQQQMPPVAESKANGVKITSPMRDQQVPVRNNVTVSGRSKYNATSNCQFGIKPYQNAVGLSGTDYSNWKYALGPTYHVTIQEGINKITAKLLCQADPYPRIYDLRKAGLIRKSNKKYHLNSFGKVVYEAQKLIEKGKQDYWKLEAIDSIESVEISTDEGGRIIDTIIETEEIKNILINHGSNTISKR
jgi:hypothetical protein